MARGKHEAPAGAVESKNQAAGAASSGLHEAGAVTPVLPAGESLADRMGNEMPSGVRGFDHRNHSRKVRITLSICAVLLVALLAALVYFFLGFVNEAQDLASDSTDDSATVIVTGDMRARRAWEWSTRSSRFRRCSAFRSTMPSRRSAPVRASRLRRT